MLGVVGGEIETHMLIPLTGKEERFGRMWGGIKCFNLASKRGLLNSHVLSDVITI